MSKEIYPQLFRKIQFPCAIIDDEDFEILIEKNWNFMQCGQNGYLYCGNSCSMHRFIVQKIMKLEIPKGYHVHHKDGNGLNNRKFNLQIISPRENNYAKDRSNKKSKYIGVCWRKYSNDWFFVIHYEGKKIIKQSFKDEKIAAAARNYYIRLMKWNIPITDEIKLNEEETEEMFFRLAGRIRTGKYWGVTAAPVRAKNQQHPYFRVRINNKNHKFGINLKTEKEALEWLNNYIIKNNLQEFYPLQTWRGPTTEKEKTDRKHRKY